jgi:glutamate:GABA antiporter
VAGTPVVETTTDARATRLGVFPLAMLSVAYIASLSGTPALAEYGFTSLFFYGVAILFLLIPTALVAAELATGWPRTGGIYAWAAVAFGERFGFMTVWLQWFAGVIAMPAIMSVITVNASYIVDPDLGSNKVFLFTVIVVTIWLMTVVALRGPRDSARLTNIAVLGGIVVPGLLLGIIGLIYVLQGKPSQLHFQAGDLVPDLGNVHTLVLASSAFLIFAGVEQSAAHAGDVRRPGRDFPRAILLATLIVLAIIVPATLAIAAVVPAKQLSLVGGLSQAFAHMLGVYDLQWLVRVIAALIVGGLLIQVQALFAGPVRGVAAAGQNGALPATMSRVNPAGMPTKLLVVQASVGTVLASLFLLLPSANGVFWIFTALQTQLILVMYVLMYATAITLRWRHPHVERAFKIPGGIAGVIAVGGVGVLACLTVIALNLLPPAQIADAGEHGLYTYGMVLGVVGTCVIPLGLFAWTRRRARRATTGPG